MQALQAAISDKGFAKIQTPIAIESCHTAELLLKWCSRSDNKEILSVFATSLVSDLSTSLQQDTTTKSREKMWGRYHHIRISDNFRDTWCKFIRASIGCSLSSPILYQYITDEILVGDQYRVKNSSFTHKHPDQLTYEEKNAICYAGGYVCAKLRNKYPLTRHLISSYVQEGDESNEWVITIDRGGLVHIKESTYILFEAMEKVVQQTINIKPHNITKCSLITCILEDDDVIAAWKCLEVNDNSLFNSIMELWITIRGFSYASGFMELYKQQTKKGLQRAKALRKDIA